MGKNKNIFGLNNRTAYFDRIGKYFRSLLSLSLSPNFCAFLLVPTIVFSTLITFRPEITLQQTLRLLAGMGIFFLIQIFGTTHKRIWAVTIILILTGIFLAAAAPFIVDWHVSKVPFLPSAFYNLFPTLTTDTVNPSVMGGYILILLPIPLAFMLFSYQKLNPLTKSSLAAGILLMFSILILTQTRGAWFAFGVVFVIMVGLRWGWKPLVCLFTSGFVVIAVSPPVQNLLMNAASLTNWRSRIEIWQNTLFALQDFPLGIGMGLFLDVIPRTYPSFQTYSEIIPHAHNLYLQIAVDLGLPGLIAWLGLAIMLLSEAWLIYRDGQSQNNPFWKALGAGLFCSQIGLHAHGMVDAVTWGIVRPAALVWVVWGLIAAARKLQKQSLPKTITADRYGFFPAAIGLVWLISALLCTVTSFTAYRILTSLNQTLSSSYKNQAASCQGDLPPQPASLSIGQRSALGGILLAHDCTNQAIHLLPDFSQDMERAEQVAYQWGVVALKHKNTIQAVSWWRHIPNIEMYILFQAKSYLTQDVGRALPLYQAAVMASTSQVGFAKSLRDLEEDLPALISSEAFENCLDDLITYYGSESRQGFRLRGDLAVLQGNNTQAFQYFQSALNQGQNDSETYYELGSAAWRLNDRGAAEQAFKMALDTNDRLDQYRPWYMFQLAKLLAEQNRIDEAVLYQESAAALSQETDYWDYLSELYALNEDPQQAFTACARATEVSQTTLSDLECKK